MKAIMEVPITKVQGGIRFATLEVELPFPPHIGMLVWHVAWKDGREVKAVSLQFDEANEPSIIVSLEPERTNNEEEQNQILEQYKGHGWTTPA